MMLSKCLFICCCLLVLVGGSVVADDLARLTVANRYQTDAADENITWDEPCEARETGLDPVCTIYEPGSLTLARIRGKGWPKRLVRRHKSAI